MVVGNGMMATAFAAFGANSRIVIFTSGVSHSLETDSSAFAREKNLLRRTRTANPDKLLVYFGTCSVDDPDRCHTPYVVHKLEMESILTGSLAPWMVLRLPLAIGPKHRASTLAQFLYDRISREESFEVWNHANRYPIDIEDVFRIAKRLIEDRSMWDRRINIALRAYPVLEFVRVMEKIVGKNARYTLKQKGRYYEIPCPEVAEIVGELNLDHREEYLENVLRKYFGGKLCA